MTQGSPRAEQTPPQQPRPSHASSSSPDPPAPAAQHTPPKQKVPSTGSAPGSASKRRHRKLAVNFEAAKVTE